MRVLFLTRKWPPAVGGMETYCVELVRELEKAAELTLHALPGPTDGGAPRMAAILGFAARTALRLLVAPGHDVIHGADMAIWPLALMALIRAPRAGVVLSVHGTDVSFAERAGLAPALYRLYMRLGSLLLRRARVLANSQATAARCRALGFRSVDVIPLATRPLAPAAPPDAPKSFILFAGRLIRRKGFAWFVTEVLPLLPREITLKVAGTVWDQAERAALASDRITYLGAVDQAELGRLMAEALCVVAPNIPAGRGHFEGFGLVAVETAMAGGVMVAARMDGYTDSVLDGETGFLVAPQSPPAWAEKILEIASWSRETRRTFTDGAAEQARAHFTWQRVARQTLDAYRAARG